MIEDEIQYLGTKMTPSAIVGRSFTPSTSVTGKARMPRRSIFRHRDERTPLGVILHVEGSGIQAPFEMRFLRTLTRSVTIGRKSTSDHKSAPGEPSIAGFACQVVSGKHAKLAFSDTGLVSSTLASHSIHDSRAYHDQRCTSSILAHAMEHTFDALERL